MLYVDKLLNTPFRVLARMVDTLACRRVEMLLAETLQVQFDMLYELYCDMDVCLKDDKWSLSCLSRMDTLQVVNLLVCKLSVKLDGGKNVVI